VVCYVRNHAAHSLFKFHPRLLAVPRSRREFGSAPLFCSRKLSRKILVDERQYSCRECTLKGKKTKKGNRISASTKREADFTYYQETAASDKGHGEDVRIQLMAEHIAQRGALIRDVYFEGGDVLRCYCGRFRFGLEGCEPIEIGEQESIVVYPGQRVTIEALDKVNLLVYVILEGAGVAPYFDRLGFFNGIHGRTSTQIELFRDVKHRLEAKGVIDRSKLMSRLSDALVTYAHDLRVGTNAVVSTAIRQIRKNLKNKIVRLTPLYEQLHIGHTALSQAFKRAGLGSPAEFIRREQLRQVRHLLTQTQKPIANIAEETGFISPTHFANFVKRMTGKTAREIRRGG